MQEQVIMSWFEEEIFFFFSCLLRCLLFWMMFFFLIFLDYFFSLFIRAIFSHLREYKEDLRSLDQCLTSLEHDARQSRLAMEADGQADTKTRERTEGAATAVRAMHGDSCSANRVDPDPMCSTSCGDDCTGSPALPCSRENTLVDNGDAAPKSCLSPLERDALTNSRRWLTPRRRNLYGNEDNIRPPNSMVLPNQRDTFEKFDSIHLLRQQFLLGE